MGEFTKTLQLGFYLLRSDLYFGDIAKAPLSIKFARITTIRHNAYNKEPKLRHASNTIKPDLTLVDDEIGELTYIANSIPHSEDLEKVIIAASDATLEKLRDDLPEIARLHNRKNEGVTILLNHIHTLYVDALKNQLGDDSDMAQHIKKGEVKFLDRLNGSKTLGEYADTVMTVFGDRQNDSVSQSINVLFHEMAHYTEDIFSSFYKSNSDVFPEKFKHHAQANALQDAFNATIPSSLYPAYRAQFCEKLAFNVGENAERKLIQIVQKATLSNEEKRLILPEDTPLYEQLNRKLTTHPAP